MLMLKTFLSHLVIVYPTLVSLYLIVGLLVTFYTNKRLDLPKIQAGIEKPGQTRRDILQSIWSLSVVSSLFSAGWTLQQFGYALFPLHNLNAFTFIIEIFVSIVAYDTWFYWFHRLIHLPIIFKHVHAWHHYSRVPNVWTNNSDSVLDNLFLQSYWFFTFLVLPIHPIVFFIHKILFDQITSSLGHAGYEYCGRLGLPPSPLVTTTHHDQHHSNVKCNFSTQFIIWDKIMGTLHKDYNQVLKNNLTPVKNKVS